MRKPWNNQLRHGQGDTRSGSEGVKTFMGFPRVVLEKDRHLTEFDILIIKLHHLIIIMINTPKQKKKKRRKNRRPARVSINMQILQRKQMKKKKKNASCAILPYHNSSNALSISVARDELVEGSVQFNTLSADCVAVLSEPHMLPAASFAALRPSFPS